MVADVIVVGAGYFGASVTYNLALKGLKVVLLEQKEVLSGASGGNFGRVQLQDAELGLSFELTLLSWQRILNLERELEADIEFRRSGSLIVATDLQEWMKLQQIQQQKRETGIAIELLERHQIKKIEPHLDTNFIEGASYCLEGQLNPFKLVYAFIHKASDLGVEILENTPVTGFKIANGKIREVITTRGNISAGIVILTTGAWTAILARKVGLDIPIKFVWGEALVTEKVGPLLNNYFSLASFFEHQQLNERKPRVSLCCTPTDAGNLLIGETMTPGEDCELESSENYLSQKENLIYLSQEMLRFFPGLGHLKVIRSWRVPVAYTADHKPYLGFFGPENLLIAAGFKSSAIMTPIVGQIVTELVTQGKCSIDLKEFQEGRGKCSN